MTTIVALGDSLTCGEGVGVRVPAESTWVALLASAAPRGRLLRLAVAGARVHDIRHRQLPLVPSADVATMIAGLNDIARSGFHEEQLREDLVSTVRELRSRAALVLVGRLHDPSKTLPLPSSLAAVVGRRIAVVNAAVDEAGKLRGVHVVDLAQVPTLARSAGWSTDRIHPSRAGHQAIAAAAIRSLQAVDPKFVAPPLDVSRPVGPSAGATAWWAVRYGMPYVAGHLTEFGPAALSALARRS